MLRVSALRAGYGGCAVAQLSALELAPGCGALLLGNSGSGKSTLLMAIAGLLPALAGRVTIDGRELTAMSAAQCDYFRGSHIGFVFQEVHLVAGLSALDNMLLAPYAAGLPQDRVRALALLEEVGLSTQARQPADALSRGQAQRVAIARAMLLRPRLILADEPTASLDDYACAAVAQLLMKAVEQSGAALLVATHDARLRAHFGTVVRAEPLP